MMNNNPSVGANIPDAFFQWPRRARRAAPPSHASSKSSSASDVFSAPALSAPSSAASSVATAGHDAWPEPYARFWGPNAAAPSAQTRWAINAEHRVQPQGHAPHAPLQTLSRLDSPAAMWRIGERIGQGASAQIFVGLAPTKSVVALRRISLRYTTVLREQKGGAKEDLSLQTLARLRNEWRAMLAAKSPLLPQQWWTTADGALWTAAPLYPYTLSAFGQASGASPAQKSVWAWHLLEQVADTLHALHNAQPRFLHMDVKPENILVRLGAMAPEFVLADFDAAIATSECEPDQRGLAGTIAYLAPEMARDSMPWRRLDGALDVFALGLTAAEFVGGHRQAGHKPKAMPGANAQAVATRPIAELPPADREVALQKLQAAHLKRHIWELARLDNLQSPDDEIGQWERDAMDKSGLVALHRQVQTADPALARYVFFEMMASTPALRPSAQHVVQHARQTNAARPLGFSPTDALPAFGSAQHAVQQLQENSGVLADGPTVAFWQGGAK